MKIKRHTFFFLFYFLSFFIWERTLSVYTSRVVKVEIPLLVSIHLDSSPKVTTWSGDRVPCVTSGASYGIVKAPTMTTPKKTKKKNVENQFGIVLTDKSSSGVWRVAAKTSKPESLDWNQTSIWIKDLEPHSRINSSSLSIIVKNNEQCLTISLSRDGTKKIPLVHLYESLSRLSRENY